MNSDSVASSAGGIGYIGDFSVKIRGYSANWAVVMLFYALFSFFDFVAFAFWVISASYFGLFVFSLAIVITIFIGWSVIHSSVDVVVDGDRVDIAGVVLDRSDLLSFYLDNSSDTIRAAKFYQSDNSRFHRMGYVYGGKKRLFGPLIQESEAVELSAQLNDLIRKPFAPRGGVSAGPKAADGVADF